MMMDLMSVISVRKIAILASQIIFAQLVQQKIEYYLVAFANLVFLMLELKNVKNVIFYVKLVLIHLIIVKLVKILYDMEMHANA
jgi:hypothetical protein